MSLRPGTSGAKTLYSTPAGHSAWNEALQSYEKALELVSQASKKPNLKKLDNWLNTEYSQRQSASEFKLSELEKVMEWKLSR